MNVLAIDIGGTSVKLCLADEKGTVTQFKEIESGASRGGPYLVDNLIEVISANYSGFEAIGISTAGQVNSEEGSIIFANENFPNYTGMNMKSNF